MESRGAQWAPMPMYSQRMPAWERESVSAERESKEEWERERACVWLSMRVSVIVPLF